jgi:hypothetical protein
MSTTPSPPGNKANSRVDPKQHDNETTAAETKQRTIAYLLFGIDLNDDVEEKRTADQAATAAAAAAAVNPWSNHSSHVQRDTTEITGDVNINNNNNNKLKAALDEVDRQIPIDGAAIRRTPLFAAALSSLQWQRDNYMVGAEYADWRKRDKERGRNGIVPRRSFRIPYDYSSAMVHGQLRPILVDFIPSCTVVQALTPIVADLPLGILYDTISLSTMDLIHSQRTNLNFTFKDQLLSILRDPSIRNQIKASMQGFIINKSESSIQ